MSLPPIVNSPLFNSSYFNASNGYLTITTGDQRYLRLGGVGTLSALSVMGNLDCGSLTLGGSALDLSGLSYAHGYHLYFIYKYYWNTHCWGATKYYIAWDSNYQYKIYKQSLC
ncbi:uncharacterized protein PITG_14033 [Phytophthora infestans T30-4]|uniref:Uncharacterized protein n=1 Tax=Phytophthora infestans (strain T30-4) TaxID=403677 RepID=D0NNG9_PHYIT|nr:uncharacterized protein PITG_14033 [Phytophthora infestans T30-4]EEY62140.1 hypothetical protein PITG_14033 [Phytophthora infestans T30-4]|eukprot:XP_002899171.1 hypothetical protein PITG_14033 [Phytophthora infestans T30-4]